ncbi:VOC family protein [Roseovarius sp. 10]|jgi:catechol 2,3-dioxygenase-like lactoylglutathione lyase family enzyme|uniref:VOC family protein n=1 Tax=Roseovarius sp. 10 TaxID=3080563 RepID=UPI002955D854|nr:VOC family protein [Roseovarius sp. 10]MDV7201729.1 VOC family protein [Roseovarius sp. 10]
MAMPGMRGMEHIGFTVPDIDEACDFFERILGAEVLYTAAKDFKGEGSWMSQHLRVDDRCVIKEFRYVRCGNGTNLEIFQYEAPDQVKIPPKNSDIGGHHLAFYVDDMDAAIDFLKANNVEILGEPTSYTDGPNLGLTWCYFMAPWGMQLEIVSAPKGTVFDNEAKAAGRSRLFHPAKVDETKI